MSITIFSGPVHSGKTTALMEWVQENNNAKGILMPDINGKRMFYDIGNKTFFPAMANPNENAEDEIISVGKYSFSKRAFEKANEILAGAIEKNPSIIIVDEVGKLELKGGGLCDAVKLLVSYSRKEELKLLFVVRDELIQAVRQYFGLEKEKLINHLPGFNAAD
jgi:nucleoside-triphosphatase